MPSYYKKVEAEQFVLTDDQKAQIKKGQKIKFQQEFVRWNGGERFLVTVKKDENFLRLQETQWLVKHPEGYWQVLWPADFDKWFVKTDYEHSIPEYIQNQFRNSTHATVVL